MNQTRREFFKAGAAGVGIWCLQAAAQAQTSPTSPKIYRAAVIGRTGGGDYGHGYENIFKGLENVTLEAIADHDPEGLRKAAERSGAKRQYLDYREMLRREKPNLVGIAMRQPDCHKEMALAAIEAGAHIFLEKPMTETVVDADQILEAAEKRGIKIAVAHNRRWSPEFVTVKSLINEGLIGQIREVRIQGKQDSRVGGEDMMVLGTHDFDIMRFYFGDPQWCFASVTTEDREITREDVRRGAEPLLVAGRTIRALFHFPRNLAVHWHSFQADDDWNTRKVSGERWAFEIFGTKGVIAYRSGVEFAWLDSPFLAHKEAPGWKPLPQPHSTEVPAHARHPIKSLIHAIETGGQPICSGFDGRWAIEMVAAVYVSEIRKGRIPFPLQDRNNPLLNW